MKKLLVNTTLFAAATIYFSACAWAQIEIPDPPSQEPKPPPGQIEDKTSLGSVLEKPKIKSTDTETIELLPLDEPGSIQIEVGPLPEGSMILEPEMEPGQLPKMAPDALPPLELSPPTTPRLTPNPRQIPEILPEVPLELPAESIPAPGPTLGVLGQAIDGKGFLILEVLPGSTAARMKLERGDVIMSVNGKAACSAAAIAKQLFRSVNSHKGLGFVVIDNVRARGTQKHSCQGSRQTASPLRYQRIWFRL